MHKHINLLGVEANSVSVINLEIALVISDLNFMEELYFSLR